MTALSWFAIWFALEAGLFNPQMNLDKSYEEQQFYIQMQTRVYVRDVFFVGGQIQTRIVPSEGDMIQFCPYSSLYLFEAGLDFDWLQIGFRHWCQHPSLVYGQVHHRDYEGGFEQLYVRFEGKVSLVKRERRGR